MEEQVASKEEQEVAADSRHKRGGDLYEYFPRDGDDDDDGARYERPWDAEDGRYIRMLAKGDPNTPPPKLHGHSSNNSGKRKPKKVIPLRATQIYLLDEVDVQIVRFMVYGLTKGEVEYYRNRRGEARTVLSQCAETIIIGGMIPTWTISYEIKAKKIPNFHIWGLLDIEAQALKVQRGTACLALREHAHRMDGNRIRWRDGQNPDYVPPCEESSEDKKEENSQSVP